MVVAVVVLLIIILVASLVPKRWLCPLHVYDFEFWSHVCFMQQHAIGVIGLMLKAILLLLVHELVSPVWFDLISAIFTINQNFLSLSVRCSCLSLGAFYLSTSNLTYQSLQTTSPIAPICWLVLHTSSVSICLTRSYQRLHFTRFLSRFTLIVTHVWLWW